MRPLIRTGLTLTMVLLLALALAGRAVAGGKPFSVEDMLRVAMVADVRLGPDGRRVAFTVTRAAPEIRDGDLYSRIYLAEPGKAGPRPVTPETAQCEKPSFSPDGTRLAYLQQGDDTTEAVLQNLATGQTRRLSRGQGDVLDLAFAPDGKSLAMTIVAESKGAASRNNDDADVEVLDAASGAAGLFLLPLVGHGGPRGLVTDRDVGNFVFSPDGGRIAFETTAPDGPPRGRRVTSASGAPAPGDAANTDIALVDVKTGAVTSLADTDGSEGSPRFSPDGKSVAYVSMAAPGFYFSAARVMVVPAAGGAPRALSETPDARPELLGWSAGGEAVYVREAQGTCAVIWALPVDGGPPRLVSDTPHVVASATLSPAGDAFGLVLADSSLPPEAYVTPADRFAPRAVSSVNKEFAGYRLGRTEVVRWQSTDGTTVEGLYTHPIAPASTPPPLLVELHGGPALVADRQYLGALNYYPLAVFSERGYALFQPNVRGSDGYGPAFRRANVGDWGGADFADLQSGLDALVARKLADPERLGVMGWSYGGYLAAWAIGHTGRFKAASVGAGITNLVSQCGSMDLPDFIPLYFGGEAYERFEALFDRSPLKYAAAIKTPTLFQHGVADERVPFTQSLELYTALSRLGVPTRLAAYPRSGHDVTEPALIRDLMVRNLDWFARYVPAAPGAVVTGMEQPAGDGSSAAGLSGGPPPADGAQPSGS
ncbi:S9 family peptidase [Solidesulfovibrio carbinoliphilus]|uniref:S9 family peptidase n=1 Tax=Solidesulfovibrio carbinoliphilus TaxID=345370 RepID=UPI001E651179|nr:S9 family peptidase [Solidesulfovibrio carbinoliphilus]